MEFLITSKMKYGIKFMSILYAAMFILLQSGYSQSFPTYDKMVDFLPPPPNAASITKYGDVAINKNTGSPNISIPLFTVKGSKLSTNISIGYSSNGIKVDEIASRVGMGWAINAGGVITRTMRGIADESNTRHYPYYTIATNWQTYSYMRRIAESSTTNGYDSEPDLFNFSFDGYSGSFVFDGDGYVLVNKAGIKIETDFNPNDPWNFRITTPDGVKYLFGGASAIEKTKRLQTCGKNFNEYITTAWYLKEIQHPNGENIIFTYTALNYQYDNGVTQTMFDPGLSGVGEGCNCAPIAPTTCVNSTSVQGVTLSSIESPGKAAVSFEYISRTDCTDKLISKIVYKDPVNTISSFDFTYDLVTSSSAYNSNQVYYGQDITPYLKTLIENSSDNLLHKKHYFSYIDPEGRPRRLSYSQDHWGYFNGKVNTSFTPYMGLYWQNAFPNATANREPDFTYAQKGLLQKVVYPTGGTTTIFYEPNVYYDGYNQYSTLHKLSCDVTGSGLWVQETKSKIFHSEINQQIKMDVQCRDNSGNGSFDSIHNKGTVQIKDYTTNQVVFSDVYYPGYSGTVTTYLPTPGHDYQLILIANGTVVTTLATLEFYPAYTPSVSTSHLAGGIRVEKLATANPGGNPIIKKYFYGTLDNLGQSSLNPIGSPRYLGYRNVITPCSGIPGAEFVCEYTTLNSSSLFNLGYFNNSLVSYHSVVESIGENFEGGGTETKFLVNSDALGVVLYNNDIINSPFSNFSSFYNSKPNIETIVKKMPDGSLKPVRKTEYAYTNDPAGYNTVYGYSIVQRNPEVSTPDTTCDITVNPNEFGSCFSILQKFISKYDMVRYSVFSSWIYPSAQTETIYDENGENPVTTTTNSYYQNMDNFQLTKSEVINSKGQLLRTTNKYPHDYQGTQVYADMISNHIINPLINTKSEIVNDPGPNTTQSEQQLDFSNTGNNNFVPVAVKKSVKGNALEIEGTIDQYDDNGNILQFTGKSGITTSIVWGYNYQYPVAQVIGSTYSNAIAQLSVSIASLQTMDGSSLITELNRIRTNIPGANVTTYTYKHLAGVNTITDPNNKTNTYEYDSFNRLMVIKDQDGNVVKKNEYVYANPDPNTGLTIFLNQATSVPLQCNSCSPGFTGSSSTYSIPMGKYYSLINQQDADDKAAADLATYGQEYANKNGYCSNSITCTAPGYKFVSCACELGERICEYSTEDPNNPGSWFTHLHLRWSDGSISPSFTDYITSCTGIDKKVLNCVCETGTKVCEIVVDNGGGSYTLTYHYLWSDASTSSQIVETINCSGPDKKIINCTCETGVKMYYASQYCSKFDQTPGCCPNMWLCTYRYRFSDGSYSAFYTECSATDCIIN